MSLSWAWFEMKSPTGGQNVFDVTSDEKDLKKKLENVENLSLTSLSGNSKMASDGGPTADGAILDHHPSLLILSC
jgi:hypothetical protein